MNQRNGLRTWGWAIGVLLLTLPLAIKAHAACGSPPPTERALTVRRCRVVDPLAERTLMEFADRYPTSFVESAREPFRQEAQDIVDSYRGAVLDATTAEGSASPYFYPSQDPEICGRFPAGLRMEAQVASACCDGDPNPPCYLGFSALIVKENRENRTGSLFR